MDNRKLIGRNIVKIMKRIWENSIIFVNRKIKKEILILNNIKKIMVFNWFMVFVIFKFVFLLFLILVLIVFLWFFFLFLFGFMDRILLICFLLIFFILELLNCNKSYGCWIWIENKLLWIKLILFLLWFLEFGMIILVLRFNVDLLIFELKLLIFVM